MAIHVPLPLELGPPSPFQFTVASTRRDGDNLGGKLPFPNQKKKQQIRFGPLREASCLSWFSFLVSVPHLMLNSKVSRMLDRLHHMNRGVFFLVIAVSFVLLGVGFGIASAIILSITLERVDDDVIIAALFAPPGVATAVGIVVGTIAASFSKSDPDDGARPPVK